MVQTNRQRNNEQSRSNSPDTHLSNTVSTDKHSSDKHYLKRSFEQHPSTVPPNSPTVKNNSKGIHSNSEDGCDVTGDVRCAVTLFPSWTPFCVWVVSSVLRVVYVIRPTSWWIYHPDEIFQSFEGEWFVMVQETFPQGEVAHAEAYGFGFRPYEFSPLSALSEDGANVSFFRQRELELGMHSMRSALYPEFYVIVTSVASALGLEIRPHMLWRISHAVISALLPLSVFRFSSIFFRSHDSGCVTAILVACSAHLNVLGTHPLLNSFLAPAVFWVASIYCQLLSKKNEKSNSIHDGTAFLNNGSGTAVQEKDGINTDTNVTFSAQNGSQSRISKLTFKSKTNKKYSLKTHSVAANTDKTAPLIKFKKWSLAERLKDAPRASDNLKFLLCGLVSALCAYVRIDSAIFLAVTLLPVFSLKHANYFALFLCALGASLGLCVCIYEDFLFYGALILSPRHWLDFNVLKDLPSSMLGTSGFVTYFKELFVDCAGLSALAFVCFVLFLYSACSKSRRSRDNCSHRPALGRMLLLTLSSVALFLLYSIKGHKELRFIHNIVVNIFITFGFVISDAAQHFRKLSGDLKCKAIVLSGLLLFALHQWHSFPSVEGRSNERWAYQRAWDSHDVSACFAYVSDQSDVTGVFVDRNLFLTGGFSLLHHDVPLWTFLDREFVEFDASSKTFVIRGGALTPRRNVSFVSMDKISNFVSVQNVGYMVRLLVEKTHFNYLVIERSRRFLDFGYREVFHHGTMRVVKRTYNHHEESQLRTMASRVPVGVNATVLQYEGDVLFRFHRFRLAIERYQEAMKLRSTHAQTFLGMAACSTKLGDKGEAIRWMRECVKRFGPEECDRPLSITNINPGRNLF